LRNLTISQTFNPYWLELGLIRAEWAQTGKKRVFKAVNGVA